METVASRFEAQAGESAAGAASPQLDVVLVLEGVTKEYPEASGRSFHRAVDSVSLQVRRGEILCLMGSSGSGKSTLLRHMNGLVYPSAGEVLVDGLSVGDLTPQALRDLRSRKIGMVFQSFGLLPHRTVRENVALPLLLRGQSQESSIAAADTQLAAVGLTNWAERFPHELSGGMQQRVGLARALVGEPEILLMDEPFSALDPTIRRELQAHFVRLVRERSITTVLVTHDPAEALRMGDRIAVLRDGKLVQVGTPEEVTGAPADAGVANFFYDGPLVTDPGVAGNVSSPPATSHAEVDIRKLLGLLRSLLFGPANAVATGNGGLFWLGLLLEMLGLFWIGSGLVSHQTAALAAGVATVIFTRVAACWFLRLKTPVAGVPWTSLAVLLLCHSMTLWHSAAPEAQNALVHFPADRQLLVLIAGYIDQAIAWSQVEFQTAFLGVIVTVRTVIETVETVLGWLPWPTLAVALVYGAWRSAGLSLALTTSFAVVYIGLFGFWERTISTVALVGASVLIALVIGVPLGILLAKKTGAQRVLTPLLDVMQTLPTFVYLIPAVAFFSVGKTPAVIATVTFALAPMIRLTALGIREVPKSVVEAVIAHGASPWQVLTRVELPLAANSLLLGINQTIVMSLSMVVVAALIGAGGLGYDVMTALRNINGGQGLLAGIAIVFCALIPDRIIQATLQKRSSH